LRCALVHAVPLTNTDVTRGGVASVDVTRSCGLNPAAASLVLKGVQLLESVVTPIVATRSPRTSPLTRLVTLKST
jgi:hypothetical protein